MEEVPHSTVGWKVMSTIFWDYKGMLLVDYIPQKTTMTVECWQICVRQWRRGGGECWPEIRCCCTVGLMLRRSCLKLMSQGHRVWADVSPTLLTRPDTQRLLPISTSEAAPSQNEVFRWWWAVAGHGVVSRQHAPGILFDWNKRTFWQNVKSVLMYREITLKNNVIVLSVPFVHHTELQNFFIAPRSNVKRTGQRQQAWKLTGKAYSTCWCKPKSEIACLPSAICYHPSLNLVQDML